MAIMKSAIRKNREGFHSIFPQTNPENPLKTNLVQTEDEENYVGDELAITRLENIVLAIKNGEYDEETKQAIYYYAENFAERTKGKEPSVYSQHVADARKYFVAGWWMYNMLGEEEKMTSTVIEKE